MSIRSASSPITAVLGVSPSELETCDECRYYHRRPALAAQCHVEPPCLAWNPSDERWTQDRPDVKPGDPACRWFVSRYAR